jgi:hypothetical protein
VLPVLWLNVVPVIIHKVDHKQGLLGHQLQGHFIGRTAQHADETEHRFLVQPAAKSVVRGTRRNRTDSAHSKDTVQRDALFSGKNSDPLSAGNTGQGEVLMQA